ASAHVLVHPLLGPGGTLKRPWTLNRLSTQLAALLLVVAAVEDVPLAAAGDHALRHAGARELVQAAVEGEALGEPALRLGEEEPLVADAAGLLSRDGLQEGVGQEREARLGERHSANPRCCAMRCFTSCSTRRRSRSARRTPGAPLRTRRSASALASRSISASSSKLRARIAAKRARIVSSGASGSSSWACTSRLTRLSATRSICAGDGRMAKTYEAGARFARERFDLMGCSRYLGATLERAPIRKPPRIRSGDVADRISTARDDAGAWRGAG